MANKLQQDAYRFPGHILEFKEQVVNNNASLPSPTDVVTMPMPSLMDQQIPHPAPSIQGELRLTIMMTLNGEIAPSVIELIVKFHMGQRTSICYMQGTSIPVSIGFSYQISIISYK